MQRTKAVPEPIIAQEEPIIDVEMPLKASPSIPVKENPAPDTSDGDVTIEEAVEPIVNDATVVETEREGDEMSDLPVNEELLNENEVDDATPTDEASKEDNVAVPVDEHEDSDSDGDNMTTDNKVTTETGNINTEDIMAENELTPTTPVDRNGIAIKVGDWMWTDGWDNGLCRVVGVGDDCFFSETDDDMDTETDAIRVRRHNIDASNKVNFVHPAEDTVENIVECIDTHYGSEYVPVEEMIRRFTNLITKMREEETGETEEPESTE